MYCRICGGPLTPLGYLGALYWCRCRNCGLDQTAEPEPEDENPDEDDDR